MKDIYFFIYAQSIYLFMSVFMFVCYFFYYLSVWLSLLCLSVCNCLSTYLFPVYLSILLWLSVFFILVQSISIIARVSDLFWVFLSVFLCPSKSVFQSFCLPVRCLFVSWVSLCLSVLCFFVLLSVQNIVFFVFVNHISYICLYICLLSVYGSFSLPVCPSV